MKRIIKSIFICFLSLSVSVLLYNFLTMGKRYVIEWLVDAVPVGVLGSPFVAVVISLFDEGMRRFSVPKFLSFGLYLVGYTIAWVYIALAVSKTYILCFGNTWTDGEILDEMVFMYPVFTVLVIGVSGVGSYLLIRRTKINQEQLI